MTSYSSHIRWSNKLDEDVAENSVKNRNTVNAVGTTQANKVIQKAIDYSKNYFAYVSNLHVQKESSCTL